MKYNFDQISLKQKDLDEYIKNNSKELNTKRYWSYRVIALNVEINELFNEIKFFKFWSKNKVVDNDKIVLELIDCIHFITSLGNTLNNEQWSIKFDDMKRPLEYIYKDLTKNINILFDSNDLKSWSSVFFNIMEIAWYLNINMEKINQVYNEKNEINYERSKNNY